MPAVIIIYSYTYMNVLYHNYNLVIAIIYVVGSEKRGNVALLCKQRYGSKHVFM